MKLPEDEELQPLTYENAPGYVSRYQSQIDDLTRQIMSRPDFRYDPDSDPLYSLYRDSYTRNGRRAMEDTLAQVSARTGGLASSYADVASQQTYDRYMEALTDKIPELQALAYSMYVDQGKGLSDRLELLTGLDGQDYDRYRDETQTRYQQERDEAQTRYKQALEKAQTMASVGDFSGYLDVGYSQDLIDALTAAYADQKNYESEQARYKQALEKAQTMAAIGDYSGYLDIGYSQEEVAALTKAYADAHAPKTQTSSGGSGSGGGSSASAPSKGNVDYESLYRAAYESGNPKSFLAQKSNYQKYGLTSTSGLYASYQVWEKAGSYTRTVYGFPRLISGAGEATVLRQAAQFVEENPDIAWDSRTVSSYLSASDLTSSERQVFMNYLKKNLLSQRGKQYKLETEAKEKAEAPGYVIKKGVSASW